ncbi:MAG: homoserine kinase [Magnetococcales bacterium]|nr:homoserine kinase [Magnetococcales bacterium]
MSVYTRVSLNELTPLVRHLGLGKIKRLDGISDGVVNTNYRVMTDSGSYVLTLVENPEESDALSYVAGLLIHLTQKGIPCPQPLTNAQGCGYFSIKNRPALLATFLPGISPEEPTRSHCLAVGKMLARIHLAGADYPHRRPNPMGLEKWSRLLDKISPKLAVEEPEIQALLQQTYKRMNQHYPRSDLPSGLCHGDLFPDNSFFMEETISGVIDFFFACNETYLLDLAITLNAWCFNRNGDPIPIHWQTLLDGYQSVRPLTSLENQNLTLAAQGAALRFSLTRFHDRYFPRPGLNVTQKDPKLFVKRLIHLLSSPS